MVVGGMELNSLNCIVLSLVLAATLLTYLLMGCLVITMGAAIKPDSGYYKHYTSASKSCIRIASEGS